MRKLLTAAVLFATVAPVSCTPAYAAPSPTPTPVCVRQHPRVTLDPAPEWMGRCARNSPDNPWTCYPFPGEEVFWVVTVSNFDAPATCGPASYSASLGGGRTSPGEKIPPYLKLDPAFYPTTTVPAGGEIRYWAESYAIEYSEAHVEVGPMPAGEFWSSTLTWRKGSVNGTGVVFLWVVPRPAGLTPTPVVTPTPVPSPQGSPCNGVFVNEINRQRMLRYLTECP